MEGSGEPPDSDPLLDQPNQQTSEEKRRKKRQQKDAKFQEILNDSYTRLKAIDESIFPENEDEIDKQNRERDELVSVINAIEHLFFKRQRAHEKNVSEKSSEGIKVEGSGCKKLDRKLTEMLQKQINLSRKENFIRCVKSRNGAAKINSTPLVLNIEDIAIAMKSIRSTSPETAEEIPDPENNVPEFEAMALNAMRLVFTSVANYRKPYEDYGMKYLNDEEKKQVEKDFGTAEQSDPPGQKASIDCMGLIKDPVALSNLYSEYPKDGRDDAEEDGTSETDVDGDEYSEDDSDIEEGYLSRISNAYDSTDDRESMTSDCSSPGCSSPDRDAMSDIDIGDKVKKRVTFCETPQSESGIPKSPILIVGHVKSILKRRSSSFPAHDDQRRDEEIVQFCVREGNPEDMQEVESCVADIVRRVEETENTACKGFQEKIFDIPLDGNVQTEDEDEIVCISEMEFFDGSTTHPPSEEIIVVPEKSAEEQLLQVLTPKIVPSEDVTSTPSEICIDLTNKMPSNDVVPSPNVAEELIDLTVLKDDEFVDFFTPEDSPKRGKEESGDVDTLNAVASILSEVASGNDKNNDGAEFEIREKPDTQCEEEAVGLIRLDGSSTTSKPASHSGTSSIICVLDAQDGLSSFAGSCGDAALQGDDECVPMTSPTGSNEGLHNLTSSAPDKYEANAQEEGLPTNVDGEGVEVVNQAMDDQASIICIGYQPKRTETFTKTQTNVDENGLKSFRATLKRACWKEQFPWAKRAKTTEDIEGEIDAIRTLPFVVPTQAMSVLMLDSPEEKADSDVVFEGVVDHREDLGLDMLNFTQVVNRSKVLVQMWLDGLLEEYLLSPEVVDEGDTWLRDEVMSGSTISLTPYDSASCPIPPTSIGNMTTPNRPRPPTTPVLVRDEDVIVLD